MKNINEIPFITAQNYFLHCVNAYILTYNNDYFKNSS